MLRIFLLEVFDLSLPLRQAQGPPNPLRWEGDRSVVFCYYLAKIQEY